MAPFRSGAAGRAFHDAWQDALAAAGGRSFCHVADGLPDFDVTAALSPARVPVLAVAGEHDPLAGPETVRRVTAVCPGAGLHIVPGAANLEAPEVFNHLILDLLDRGSPT